MNNDNNSTIKFKVEKQPMAVGEIILAVHDALSEKGYNPINQIVGYILSEDPTYITTHNNARNLIRKIDRDTLLQTLVKYYMTNQSLQKGWSMYGRAIFNL